MNRKFFVLALVLVLLVVGVPSVFAAIDQAKQKEIQALYQQMFEIQKQLVEKYQEAGLLTPEQAQLMKDRLKALAQNPPVPGNTPVPGFRGPGWGMGPAFGPRFGGWGCPGAWYYGGPGAPVPPGANTPGTNTR